MSKIGGISYTMNDTEAAAAQAFIAEQTAKLLEEQRITMEPSEFRRMTGDGRYPYTGAIGGMFSYVINPCSIGSSIAIRNNFTKEELDLTDYDRW